MDYLDAIKFLQSFPDMERGTAPTDNLTMSLASMKSLLARLDSPQCERKTVHIAGSKGKGSTSTMVANILQNSGQRTALYTSPHLHTYRERIQIDSRPVSEPHFAEAVTSIKQAVEAEHGSGDGPLVTFGILTALFFEIARAQKADWQVVEVGLGGLEDATNVFQEKQVAVITPISLEHSAILGNTPAAIAVHKCGIITEGSTAVLAPQRDAQVKSVVEMHCKQVGAHLIDVESTYQCAVSEMSAEGQTGHIVGPNGSLNVGMRMLGKHQLRNAATAVAVADALRNTGTAISDRSIVDGLAASNLPGRFEILRRQPTVVADGAHNGESAGVLRSAMDEIFNSKRRILIIGVNRDKDVGAMLEELAPASDRIIATRSLNARSKEADEIAAHPLAASKSPFVCASVPEALDKALALAAENDLICITGSLYVVAEARRHLLGIEHGM